MRETQGMTDTRDQGPVRLKGQSLCFDYLNQAWAERDAVGIFRYKACNHNPLHACTCYGKRHEGEAVDAVVLAEDCN